ncbi:MAG: BatD family protein [Opitutaceae bacterium]
MNATHIISILLLLTASVLSHAAVTVTAQFQPQSIQLGDKSQYVVSIKQTSETERPEIEEITSLPIPQTGGLTLSNGRVTTSQQSTIRNFKAEHSITQNIIIEAQAPRVGSYTVPSYRFSYKGEMYTAPSATLRVVERSADAPPPINELIFLRVEAPKELYVGQAAPINLKLYVHEKARYRGYDDFTRNADGFTMGDLPEGSESVERVGDYRYKVITWPLIITPIQGGEQDLNFEFSVVADLPSQQNRRSPFGGSLFNDFFSTRSERFNLFNEPTKINVLQLPEADQPKSFSGAIGDFSIQVTTDAKDSRVGEPIMLSLKVSGSGNFDRINGPTLPESPLWRNYSPEASMVPSPTNPLKGMKRFDYVFIPQKAGKLTLPEVEFSFFDPKDKEYVTMTAPPIAVDVGASLQAPLVAPQTAPQVEESEATIADLTKSLSPEEALLTLDYQPKRNAPTGFALLERPIFYVINGAACLALLGAGFLLHKRKRLATDPTYAKQHAARAELREALKAVSAAETRKDANSFYHSAQAAVRLAATIRFKRNLRSAESSELENCFSEHSINAEAIESAKTLFRQADALRFSGNANSKTDLSSDRQQLNTILKAL